MTKLEQAARALLVHWDTPAWKYLKPTGDLMAALREALAKQAEKRPQNCGTGYRSCIECPYEAEQAEQEPCKECGAKQAQIDRLMLEYCPDEMTPEQMQEWGNNQRPVEQVEYGEKDDA